MHKVLLYSNTNSFQAYFHQVVLRFRFELHSPRKCLPIIYQSSGSSLKFCIHIKNNSKSNLLLHSLKQFNIGMSVIFTSDRNKSLLFARVCIVLSTPSSFLQYISKNSFPFTITTIKRLKLIGI